jgi:hypothetical protein
LTYLVEILLPLADKAGEMFRRRGFPGDVTRSADIVIFEVMTDDLERAWWSACRARLEAKFAQDEVLIRAASIEWL